MRKKAAVAVAAAAVLAGLSVGSAQAMTPADTTRQHAVSLSSSCGYYSGTKVTRRGDTGDRVREVQCLLIGWGFDVGPSGIDGDFGPATYNAVRDFQAWYGGLAVDGEVGKNTWPALRSG
ncbi:peptidoglycan-binding domain-containing protein [Streptomyces sp. NPDC049577]|uniref:peptidoglycan-binding domain-containing protein n=1 Tax=Streptomyces sp. NPDC049577 TaxID=3155153 RepID=UPI00343D59A5